MMKRTLLRALLLTALLATGTAQPITISRSAICCSMSQGPISAEIPSCSLTPMVP